jgi:hypothetical protein
LELEKAAEHGAQHGVKIKKMWQSADGYPMSKPIDRVEIITGMQRRRRYNAEEKVRLVEQTMQPGMTVSTVARLHGVAPSLLF